MSALEKRKKLLAAESDVYRELLKLELWNFKVYGARLKRRATSFESVAPLFAMGLPLAGSLFRRKRSSLWKKLGAVAMMGWNLYRAGARRRAQRQNDPETTAAEEYLGKRM